MMQRLFFTILKYYCLLLLFTLLSCKNDLFNECLSGRGKDTTERRGLYPFGNIAVYDNINLTVVQANEYSITLYGGDRLLPLITNLIINNTLELRNQSRCNLLKDPWEPVEVIVKTPKLDSLFIRSQGKISNSIPIKQDNLYVSAYETSADIHLDLATRFFRFDNKKGTADMYLYGHSDTVFLYNIGAGKVNATTITSDVMVVNTGSMNDTWVKSGKKILDVKITYMGNVFYSDNPEEIIYYSAGSGKLLLIN